MKKNVVILGSTGSIGQTALRVIRNFPSKFNVIGLSAYTNLALLKKQIKEFSPKVLCVGNKSDIDTIKDFIGKRKIEICSGIEGLTALAAFSEADIVLIAVTGAVGLYPLLSAIKSRKRIALANKEALVIAGGLINTELKKYSQGSHKAEIIPVDSEHSSIFQCIKSGPQTYVSYITLTASGGPFFHRKNSFSKISVTEALKHPSWKMGKSVTINSATMMNKGLEIIEAQYLFNIAVEKIQVLIHPQAIVHSLVSFIDGTTVGVLSWPDMSLPIQYSLTYPNRYESLVKPLQLNTIHKLEFYIPDYKKFPCLKLAIEVAKADGSLPVVMNAANEVCVESFLNGEISFDQIYKTVHKVVDMHYPQKQLSLEQIISLDRIARDTTRKIISQI